MKRCNESIYLHTFVRSQWVNTTLPTVASTLECNMHKWGSFWCRSVMTRFQEPSDELLTKHCFPKTRFYEPSKGHFWVWEIFMFLNFFSPLCQFMNKENVSYTMGEGRRHEWTSHEYFPPQWTRAISHVCQGVPKIKKKRQEHREKNTLEESSPGLKTRWHLNKGLEMENFMFKTINRSGSRTQVHINIQYRRRCGTIYNSYLSFFGFSVRSFLKYEEPHKTT